MSEAQHIKPDGAITAREHGVMQGFPPPPEKRITKNNWDQPPFNRWSFQNIDSVHRTRTVSRGEARVCELESNPRAIWGLSVARVDGSEGTVQDMVDESYTDGVIVLHKGKVVGEQYLNDMTRSSLHLAQSVSKSLIGTLAGIFVERGLIELNAPVETYVRELADCGYCGASVQQVLDMQSGVEFIEEYTDPNSHMGALDIAADWRDGEGPHSIYELILTLKQCREHGAYFEYRSIEADIMTWCLERVTNKHIADLVSEEIWSRLGAEYDAKFTIDRAGSALVDGGFNASLRDFARFGQMHLQEGHFNGQQIVPSDWVLASRSGNPEAFQVTMAERFEDFPFAAYTNQWWILDPERGIYQANGVFGQNIHIDVSADLVVVKLSTWPDFLNFDYSADWRAACHKIGKYLNDG